jgi:hypothetical protein
MCCGIVGSDLMVRIPLEEFDAALGKRHVRPMDFTGRPLKGFVYVAPSGFNTAASLRGWLTQGVRRPRTQELDEPEADHIGEGSDWCSCRWTAGISRVPPRARRRHP